MSVSSNLLKQLKSYKFKNNAVITYKSLNDQYDSKTITDAENEIYKILTTGRTVDKIAILSAIFNGTGLDVAEDTKNKGKFILVDSKKGTFTTLELNKVKDTIEFKANDKNVKLQFKIATPDVVEKSTFWKDSKSKNEVIKDIEKSNSKADIEKIILTLSNMLHTK